MNIKALEDITSLKELVDMISILADKKDVHTQAQLFSENATSETFVGDTAILKLKGRKEMEEAFRDFLKDFDTVYHLNGQQTVTINGDNATGTSYCLVTLIGTENGKKMKTTIGVIYHDDFVRENNRWLIARRIGNFDWQEKREVNHIDY
ncbi:nuclear transport factor 2 family protein [Chitinophaga oryziterrae]|uniref:Nuclear transport factor 2 family protein n=1 Tax=Chitinophaga oryziterrae TaxID=1031224 RepID=A0A6N8JB13_9BACT|nr:nuclear transport factor 2 family protein [Chitinophaga oryziterrae]MVT41506.1 nuclear transport factor 2 family protein [Chitinophaga oryziterrae]